MTSGVIWCCVFNLSCAAAWQAICIQRHIVGNVFDSMFTNDFYFNPFLPVLLGWFSWR